MILIEKKSDKPKYSKISLDFNHVFLESRKKPLSALSLISVPMMFNK